MKRVLFVDDEPSVLAALERMLRPHRDRWTMTFAMGGVAALAQLADQGVDVVVTDMRMPGMNGVALLALVRERHPDSIRIVLSGELDVASMAGVSELAHRLLSKPASSSDIIDALDESCR